MIESRALHFILAFLASAFLFTRSLPGQEIEGPEAGLADAGEDAFAPDSGSLWDLDRFGREDTPILTDDKTMGEFKLTPIPVLLPISDPAIGHGAALGAVFLIKKKQHDPVLGPDGRLRTDILSFGGFYTSNDSKAAFGLYRGFWFGDRLRTWTMLGAASLNLSFYGFDGGFDTLGDNGGLAYNGEGFYFKQDVRLRLWRSPAFLGLGYQILNIDNTFDIPILGERLDLGPFNTSNAGLGPTFYYDTRDNRTTPTKGHLLKVSLTRFSESLGGDFDYWGLKFNSINWWDLPGPWVIGLRVNGQFVGDDAPFYALPSIKLRGVPGLRYQAENALSAEAELQYQIAERWRLVGFGGAGTAADNSDDWGGSNTAWAGGVGFRFRALRKRGIDVGLDVARGPEETFVYVTWGNGWFMK